MPDPRNRGVFRGGVVGSCVWQVRTPATRPWWQPGGAFVPVTAAGETVIHRQLLVLFVRFYMIRFYPKQQGKGTGAGLLCFSCLSAVFSVCVASHV